VGRGPPPLQLSNSPGLTGLLPSSYSAWTKASQVLLRNTTTFGEHSPWMVQALPAALRPVQCIKGVQPNLLAEASALLKA
jgi:hypothetical protein